MFLIFHAKWPDGRPVQGTWTHHEKTVMVCCPGCKKIAALDHDVADDGTVTPSLECAYDCGFHEMAQLMDWPKGS